MQSLSSQAIAIRLLKNFCSCIKHDVLYCACDSLPFSSVLIHVSQNHNPTSSFLKIHFNIIPLHTPRESCGSLSCEIQASPVVYLRSWFFCNFTRCVLIAGYRLCVVTVGPNSKGYTVREEFFFDRLALQIPRRNSTSFMFSDEFVKKIVFSLIIATWLSHLNPLIW